MPFHGHEKQTCGLISKPWLSFVSPKKKYHRLPYLTPVFCPIQILHYCNTALQNISSDTDSKEYKHNFSKLTTLSVNTLHSVNMYYS